MLRSKRWRVAIACAVGGATVGYCGQARAQDLAAADVSARAERPFAITVDMQDASVGLSWRDDDHDTLWTASERPLRVQFHPGAVLGEEGFSRWSASSNLSSWCDAAGCEEGEEPLALRLRVDDSGLRLGAQARFAERLASMIHEGTGRPNWYLYLAADAQAMTWTPRGQDTSVITLDDMELVGDAQAGIGARVRGGDLAIGYFGREVKHLGAERQENYVGLTFAWSG